MSEFNREDVLASSPAKALPASSASAVTDSIDLTGGGIVPRDVEFEINAPSVPSLVASKDIDYIIEESADDSSFDAAPWSPMLQQTGAAAAAVTLRFRPPSNSARYIRLSATVEVAGGNNTAALMQLKTFF